MWAHARRVGAGLPLYAEPSLEFTAFPYPPLFHWFGAAALALLGDGLSSLRAVSLLGTLLLAAGLAAAVRRPAGANLRAAVIAIGVLFGGQVWAGDWLDVARIDALCMGLVAGAFVAGSGNAGLWRAALAGALGAAACLTKQSALLPVVLAWAGWALRAKGTKGGVAAPLAAAAVCAAILVGVWLALLQQAGPWLRFHLFEVLAGHPWHGPGALGFLVADLPRVLPLMLAAALAPGMAAELRRDGAWLWILGLLLMAFTGRAHIGGYDNVLLPALVAAALAAGRGVHGIVDAGPSRCRTLAAGALVLQAAVFAGLGGWRSVPAPDDEQRGDAFVARLAAMPGEVLVPAHPELSYLAGKQESLHWMALLDLSASGEGEWGRRLVSSLEAGLAAGRWSAVVLDDFGDGFDNMGPARALFARYLVRSGRAPGASMPAPATGIHAQAAEWWEPPRR